MKKRRVETELLHGGTAEQQAIIELGESLETLICGSDILLTGVGNKLEYFLDRVLHLTDQQLDKIKRKIYRLIDAYQVQESNALERILTIARAMLDGDLQRVEWLLQQLLVKSNSLPIGVDISVYLLEPETRCKELEYGGTLVLSVREALPFFEQLLEVLREIRNRMPPEVIQERGEEPADEFFPPTDIATNAITEDYTPMIRSA